MPQALTRADLELMGYTEIEERLPKSSDQCYVLKGTAAVGITRLDAAFLYAKSRATAGDIKSALAEVDDQSETYLVLPESARHQKDLLDFANSRGIEAFHLTNLLWERTHNLFGEYVSSLRNQIIEEKYFVNPRSENNPHSQLDRSLREFLTDDDNRYRGRILVLRAPAGVGKTTLVRHVVASLVKSPKPKQVLPVYVEAQHWSKLPLDAVDGLWDVILNSLRMYSSTLSVTEELFQHILRNGLIAFVFDGFDELCGHRNFPTKGGEVLQYLAETVQETEARLVLTTRTAYWDAEIGAVPTNVDIVDLAPFNSQQAKNYFDRVFKADPHKRQQAIRLYRDLEKAAKPGTAMGSKSARSKFVNLPVCVALVAEYVGDDGGDEATYSYDVALTEKFLTQLCEREQTRQNLQASATVQMTALGEVAMEFVEQSNPDFASEDLEAIGIESTDVERMSSHPLLLWNEQDKRFRFSYDFLPYFFRALAVANALEQLGAETDRRLLKLMVKESNGKGVIFDHLGDLAVDIPIANLASIFQRVPETEPDARSFLFHVASVVVELSQDNLTKAERTHAIFEALFGNAWATDKHIRKLRFFGGLSRLDFAGLTFSGCQFTNVTFVDCVCDESTRFDSCVFSGELEFQRCSRESWSKSQGWETCSLRAPANLRLEAFLPETDVNVEEHAKDALRLALEKFWRHGRLKQTIRKQHWRTGSLGHSIYCETLREAMLDAGVMEEITISGVAEGGYAFNKNCLGALQKFMDSRVVVGALAKAYARLLK